MQGMNMDGRNQKDNDIRLRRILQIMISAATVLLILITVAGAIYLKQPETQYRRFMNLGNKFLIGSQYEQAVDAFTCAIRIEPRTAEAYAGRGDAYAKLGNRDKAMDDYNKAEELNPELREKMETKKAKVGVVSKTDEVTPMQKPESTSDDSKTPSPAPIADQTPSTASETSEEDILKKYYPILKEYQDAWNDHTSGKTYADVNNFVMGGPPLEYTLYDLNGDSIPELLFKLSGDSTDIADAFTLIDDNPRRFNEKLQYTVPETESEIQCFVLEDGKIERRLMSEGEEHYTLYYTVLPNSTDLNFYDGYYSNDIDYYRLSTETEYQNPSQKIGQDEYDNGTNQSTVKTDFNWNNLSDVE